MIDKDTLRLLRIARHVHDGLLDHQRRKADAVSSLRRLGVTLDGPK
jgi:hypothetical protein